MRSVIALTRTLSAFVLQTRFAPGLLSRRVLHMTHHLDRSHTPSSMGAATSSMLGPFATAGTSATLGSKPPSKGKARATAPLPITRTTSDIENQPAIATAATAGEASSSAAPAPAPPEKETLPLYSYKQYPLIPAVVYTRHEEEANDLVGCLKGPLGFDLEWPVSFRRGRAPQEWPTALVQICDSRMIVLIQVSAMSSTSCALLGLF